VKLTNSIKLSIMRDVNTDPAKKFILKIMETGALDRLIDVLTLQNTSANYNLDVYALLGKNQPPSKV